MGVKMVQHMQINQCYTSHYLKERQNPHDHLNRQRKNIWQNSTSIHNKSIHCGGYGGNISQNNKDHL